MPAASDFRFRFGEFWSFVSTVGSRGGLEDVEGSCSWVAILAIEELVSDGEMGVI